MRDVLKGVRDARGNRQGFNKAQRRSRGSVRVQAPAWSKSAKRTADDLKLWWRCGVCMASMGSWRKHRENHAAK
jgi:hypothetical protein